MTVYEEYEGDWVKSIIDEYGGTKACGYSSDSKGVILSMRMARLGTGTGTATLGKRKNLRLAVDRGI